MEDFILREIDRIGELLLQIAMRLGLFKDGDPKCTLADVKAEFGKENIDYNLDEILSQENPIAYLVEQKGISDKCLELLTDILIHSDIDEERRKSILDDALRYLDHRGYYSFRLHSLYIRNQSIG